MTVTASNALLHFYVCSGVDIDLSDLVFEDFVLINFIDLEGPKVFWSTISDQFLRSIDISLVFFLTLAYRELELGRPKVGAAND